MSYTQRVYHGEPFKGRGSFNWFFNPGIVHSDSVVVITASEYQPEVVPPTTRMSASALRVTRTSGFPISVLTGKGHPTSACSTPSTSTFSIRCSWLSTSPCSIRRESRPSTSNSEGRLSLATLMRWLRSSSCKNRIYRVFRGSAVAYAPWHCCATWPTRARVPKWTIEGTRMSIELQLRAAALAAITSHNVRMRLRSTCPPLISGFSIDHLEVAADASVEQAASSVQVHVPVDVFVVADAALFAAVNDVPDGATKSAARITLVFELQVTLSEFETPEASRRPAGPDPHPRQTRPQGIRPVARSEGRTGRAEHPGDPSPRVPGSHGSARLARRHVAEDGRRRARRRRVAARFGVAGAPRSRLFPGQEWGLFLDSAAVEQLVRSKVEPPVKKSLPEASVGARYTSVGTVPQVDVDVGASLAYTILKANFTARLRCDFSLLPGSAPVLRTTVVWSVKVSLPDPLLLPFFLQGTIEHIAEGYAEDAIDPAQFGGTPTGAHTFVMDTAAPLLPLLGITLRYDSALGSPTGMTIGGAVVIPGLFEPPFAMTVSGLSGPTRIQLCSKRARTGSGAPSSQPPTIENTTSFGQLDLTGCGVFCGAECRTPGPYFQQYLSYPAAGSAPETASVRASIPYTVASAMTQPLTMVVRSSRGVRFVDFGLPPKAVTDASDRLLNARDYYIPDCPAIVPLEHGRFGMGWGAHGEVFKPPPLEDPSWSAFLHDGGGLVIQLVRVAGLDAGELLRLRSATHALDVTAGSDGGAVVPVMLPLLAAVQPALLVRADGRSLKGHVAVSSAVFERRFTLPGSLRSGPTRTRSGNTLITTKAADGDVVHTVTALGAVSRSATRAEAGELNPQPLPPVEVRDRELAERAGIHGVDRIIAVPGFAAAGAAVAIMSDATKLLLDVNPDGTMRISGTFSGPIGELALAGDWAAVAAPGEVALFRVSAAEPPDPAADSGQFSQVEDWRQP